MKPHFAISGLLLGVVLTASAQADDKFVCPVTRFTPVTFSLTGTFAGQQSRLLGTESLFTVFPGNWQTIQNTALGYRVPKIVWGTTKFDLHQETLNSSLSITGRRLDAESGSLQSARANTAWIDEAVRHGPAPGVKRTPVTEIANDQFFMTSEFYVPALGCWEVTGHFHGTDLKIVVDLK